MVQKTVHQLDEYNEERDGAFLEPLAAHETFVKGWGQHTANLSAEEVEDLEKARATIENYAKIYEIYEYATQLTATCNILETRFCANNVTNPLNMYRVSSSSSMENIFPEIEKCLEAYFSLIDDCAAYPDWQKKIQKELGGTVSYLALCLDEVSRDIAVETSEVYRRFDLEKQIYFK